MNIAQKISHKLGNNGRNYEDDEGTTLDELCLAEGAEVEGMMEHGVKYFFEDKSSIIDRGNYWNISGE